ncbi:dephospho-CoA kinase [Populibacterium corticicola]|uniref:Dephospho-CoA kinase n=1 Tax=Populibacterium corticicola TaxID=1812826 RepID=A0ABW5XCQ0_9MICO
MESMIRIGLTGGIASGKSAVSEVLSSLGALVVDHDVLAREAVAPGSVGLERIAAAFGSGVIDDDDSLDRTALGAIVFADTQKLEQLNSIVHPEVRRLALEADARAEEGGRIVVHDIPLLVETTQQHDFDAVIVVEAPLEQRIARMIEHRGMTREQALARIDKQASDEERRAIADYLVVNDGTLEGLDRAVRTIWQAIVAEI